MDFNIYSYLPDTSRRACVQICSKLWRKANERRAPKCTKKYQKERVEFATKPELERRRVYNMHQLIIKVI